jgi:uncharacterized protein (TIGR02147 family)
MQDISSYNDYKLYLRDIYKSKSETKHGFSFSVWSNSLGIASPSTLSMIINGKRHPSKNITSKLIEYLKLTEEQSEYFKGLIQLQKSQSNPHLTIHLNSSIKNNTDNGSDYLAMTTFIIRELLNNRTIINDVEFILRNTRAKLTRKQIQEKISFLLEKKLLVVENNNYKAIGNIFEEIVTTKEGIFNFHKSTMETNKEAFENTEISERAFHTSILSIKKNKVAQAKELLKEFQHKMTDLLEEDGLAGDQIYIMNMNLYPATDQINIKE